MDEELMPEDAPIEEVEQLEDIEVPEDTEPLEAEQHQEEPPQRNRREERMQKLANERAEALAQTKMAQEQAEFYRKQLEQQRQQFQQPQQEEEYVDPEEQWRRRIEQQTNMALMTANDLNDRAQYNMKATKNALYVQHSDRVEAMLMNFRNQGRNPSREEVLAFIVGQDALANHGKPSKTQQAARQRVAEARGATPGMKSTVQQDKASRSLEERLSGVSL